MGTYAYCHIVVQRNSWAAHKSTLTVSLNTVSPQLCGAVADCQYDWPSAFTTARTEPAMYVVYNVSATAFLTILLFFTLRWAWLHENICIKWLPKRTNITRFERATCRI